MKAIINPYWKEKSKADFSKLASYADKITQGSWNVSYSVEDLLNKINYSTNKDRLPTLIVIDYKTLLERNIDLKNITEAINLSTKIAYNRLNEKHQEITYTGTLLEKISHEEYNRLSKAGFCGGQLSPWKFGLDAGISSSKSYLTDSWHGMVVKKESANKQPDNLVITLTFRQQQILNFICRRGLTNSQIAKQLNLSESTVKMHIGIILKKYSLRHRTQLVALHKELVK